MYFLYPILLLVIHQVYNSHRVLPRFVQQLIFSISKIHFSETKSCQLRVKSYSVLEETRMSLSRLTKANFVINEEGGWVPSSFNVKETTTRQVDE